MNNKTQVDVLRQNESGHWAVGNIVHCESDNSLMECPVVAMKGTPAGDRNKCIGNTCYHLFGKMTLCICVT